MYAPRRNWDSPPPSPPRRLVCPLPPVSGGRGTLAGEKGVGRVPIPTRGIHCGTLYMYVLCAVNGINLEKRLYLKFFGRKVPSSIIILAVIILVPSVKFTAVVIFSRTLYHMLYHATFLTFMQSLKVLSSKIDPAEIRLIR